MSVFNPIKIEHDLWQNFKLSWLIIKTVLFRKGIAYYCPRCGFILDKYVENKCKKCGQVIEWSEE